MAGGSAPPTSTCSIPARDSERLTSTPDSDEPRTTTDIAVIFPGIRTFGESFIHVGDPLPAERAGMRLHAQRVAALNRQERRRKNHLLPLPGVVPGSHPDGAAVVLVEVDDLHLMRDRGRMI